MKFPLISIVSILGAATFSSVLQVSAFSVSISPTRSSKSILATVQSRSCLSIRGYPASTCLFASLEDDDDDEDAGPLSKRIDSVSWLPTVDGAKNVDLSSVRVRDGAEILPLFPLGGIVYTPNSEHVLNIFEPRYRQMYTDILMNGTKRFVVSMSHPIEKGRFAQTGVLFQLEDLKEVSEQTNDQVKYVCNHKVVGRVKMHQILNPEAWKTRDTYLKVEGTITDDTILDQPDKQTPPQKDETIPDGVYGQFARAAGVALSDQEKALRKSFKELVDVQHELEEDVRFTKASTNALAVSPGPEQDGLWQTIRLWQAYAEQRLVARQNEMQHDFQQKLQEFLTKEKGLRQDELPSAIGFQDLSPALQKEIQDLQRRMAVELEPLVLESTLTMQKILEAEEHVDRCNLLLYFIQAEKKRLDAKKILRGMFNSVPGTVAEKPDVEKIQADVSSSLSEEEKSILMDEDDAFQ